MYIVRFTNMNYTAGQSFCTAEDALEYARKCCFEAEVYMAIGRYWQQVATWSPIGGTQYR
jgi:hypothetical protein